MQLYQNTNFLELFRKYIAPNVVAAAFFSLYAIIDGAIVGSFLGSEALAAMGLVMPFVFMSFALVDMVAIGSSVQISLHLGEGKVQVAREIFSACFLLIIVFSCVLGFGAYLLMPYFLDFLDATDEIKALCLEYSNVFAFFMPTISLSYALDNYLRICEKGVYAMWVGVFVVFCNIALICLFVIVFDLGIFGAALAMCVGLSLGTILSLLPFFRYDLILKFCAPKLKFKKFLNVLYNGSSEFLANVSGSLLAVFANAVLLKLSGALSVAAYAAILYIDGVVLSVIMALNSSLQPILSYFFAQKNRPQIIKIVRFLICLNASFSLFAFVILCAFRAEFAGLFSGDIAFVNFMSSALVLYSLNYLAMWFNILVSECLTAFDKPTFSMILSLCANLIAPLGFLFVLPSFLGVNGVLLVSFFAEFCVLVLSAILLKKALKF